MTEQPADEIFLRDYRAPLYRIAQVDLTFLLHPTVTRVRARLTIARDGAPAPLTLNGEELTLDTIAIDGRPLRANEFRLGDASLTIHAPPENFVLETETIINPAANTALSGLYLSGGNFVTQCEAEGFRRITFFLDRPDVMSRYTTTIIAPVKTCPVLLGNGNPTAEGRNQDGTHFVTWADPHPKPCYLFAIVAGDLIALRDSFRTASGREVALAIWVRKGDETQCAHAMRALKLAMRWDEETFGLEYDLDCFNIVAVSDFNMGAMENKGLNIFNTKYVLAQPETATDADYAGIDTVIAHEYFHNWTGNRVTCRDWFQLSLKEGLTVFRDQEFSADLGGQAVKRIADVQRLRAAQFREDSGPLAHPVRPDRYRKIDNFYTSTVYQKGAEIIRMMRTVIGRQAFRRGMDIYIERNDNSAATIEDFVAAMEQASGTSLGAFSRWYDQAGTPEITVADAYDEASRTYTLTLTQSTPPTPNQPEKSPLVIPVATGLLGEDGKDILETVLLLDRAEQAFTFPNIPRPVPSLFREFSAPVKLKGLSQDTLRFLASHDSDRFVRWDSGQQFATALLLESIAANSKLDAEPLTGIVAAGLDLAAEDPAFAALAITLPAESLLADQMAVVDPEGIHQARQSARALIGRALLARFQSLYEALDSNDPYRFTGEEAGRRALRNACLAYIAAADTKTGAALADAQFTQAGNMTDRLAAIATLTQLDVPQRKAALAAFREQFHRYPLVLDTWFALQAASSLPSTPDAVRALTAHEDFDVRNPNRFRALIGTFAANQRYFHAADGSGYALLTEMIARADAINGQLAARTATVFAAWRRHTEPRQALMRQALQTILALPDLSENTREIATRALG